MKKNSGKNPAFQFYPNDWFRDLAEHPLEIEGAWIRIICKLWWSENRGILTKTTEQWSKMLGVSIDETKKILRYFKDENIATVTNNNEKITVMNRRMSRDDKLRIDNALRQERHRLSHKNNNTSNGEETEMYEDEVEIEVEKEKEIFKNVPIPKVLDNPECIKELNKYFKWRDETLGKPLVAIIEIEAFLNELKKLCHGNPESAIQILKNGIIGKYTAIYEIKTNTGKKEEPKPTAKKKWGIKECPHCQKVDQYRIVSESTKGIIAQCRNCNKEFEVKNENNRIKMGTRR